MKVKILHPSRHVGGIQTVVDALYENLPKLGVEFVENFEDADLINSHAGSLRVDASFKLKKLPPVVNSNHGLYWADFPWGKEFSLSNRRLIDNITIASDIIVPSRFVGRAIARGVLRRIHVVHHGTEFAGVKNKKVRNDTVLGFCKTRTDPVCNVDELGTIAQMMPYTEFHSTAIPKMYRGNNITSIGVLGRQEHLERLKNYSIYLSLPMETGDIASMEAIALGVPVIGWKRGALEEIVIEDVNGILVPYGDYEYLRDAIRYVRENIDRFIKGCSETSQRFTWEKTSRKYYSIFQEVIDRNKTKNLFSIVIPAFNSENYIGDTLKSVQNIDRDDFECIVVDDCSTDGTADVIEKFAKNDNRIKTYKTPVNSDVGAARNLGVSKADSKYILFLDSDDLIIPEAIPTLLDALETGLLHGAYTKLAINNEIKDWPGQFNWLKQISYRNQAPYCTMITREAALVSGGFREYLTAGEDAEFWARLSSFGFKIRQVGENPQLHYRFRPDSKTNTVRGETGTRRTNWLAWYPWRQADNLAEGRNVEQYNYDSLAPFGADFPEAIFPVYSRTSPEVSVVIPCTKNHLKILTEALESVQGQTMQNWECIVVYDSEDDIDEIPGFPYVTVINTNTKNPAKNRNIGALAACGEYLIFLDADDFLMPNCLKDLLGAVRNNNCLIAYGDVMMHSSTESIIKEAKLHNPSECLNGAYRFITFLIERNTFYYLGGFDETLDLYEDWDFELKTYCNDVPYVVTPVPTFVYRLDEGERRKSERKQASHEAIIKKWENKMGCLSCKGKHAKRVNEELSIADIPLREGDKVQFVGDQQGTRTFIGPVTRKQYRFSRNVIRNIGDGDEEVSAKDVFGLTDRNQRVIKSGLIHRYHRSQPLFKLIREEAAPKPAEVTATAQIVESNIKTADDYSVLELRKLARSAPLSNVEALLEQEREGKARIGALRSLEARIDADNQENS